ncbi:hypothetical protein JOC24_003402 [Streptomyces sp. HB132]|nr:hypothetical protein [Streptomyces sp. HB132]
MNDDVRNIVLGLIAAGISAAFGWLARTYLWRRGLRRKQAFFGMPGNSECLLVVNRDAGGDGEPDRSLQWRFWDSAALPDDLVPYTRLAIAKIQSAELHSETGWPA